MATVIDAPSALGDYMLRGWVLTDQSCPNPGCILPLLRSPNGQTPVIHLCVNCDKTPDNKQSPQQSHVSRSVADEPQHDVSTSISSASHATRSSTPATEVSEGSGDLPPFVETAEMRRRREQTDRASAEIGRRLLQGWTMLGDECPQESCYYVPLVRPPKRGGEKDPRKECVLCGNVYVTESDWAGREHLVVASSGSKSSENAASTPNPTPSVAPSGPTAGNSFIPQAQNALTAQGKPAISKTVHQNTISSPDTSSNGSALMIGTLETSAEALRNSLQVLSSRLTSVTTNPALIDPTTVSATAEAISKVTQALSHVRSLQWSEMQAHTMSSSS